MTLAKCVKTGKALLGLLLFPFCAALYLLATLFYEVGSYRISACLARFSRRLILDPKEEPWPGIHMLEVYGRLAAGQPGAAIAACGEWAKSDPAGLTLMGFVRLRQGEVREAEAVFEDAMGFPQQRANALMGKAVVALLNRDVTISVDYAQKARTAGFRDVDLVRVALSAEAMRSYPAFEHVIDCVVRETSKPALFTELKQAWSSHPRHFWRPGGTVGRYAMWVIVAGGCAAVAMIILWAAVIVLSLLVGGSQGKP